MFDICQGHGIWCVIDQELDVVQVTETEEEAIEAMKQWEMVWNIDHAA